jgi:pimeloyl-ACP methyl ester carboxylesterase
VTPTLEVGGIALAYRERGSGEPLLLVHGTASDGGVWRETVEALPEGLRAIDYDRRAYGGSGAPEPYGGTTVEEQADDALSLLEALGATPALVCGHDLGALVCLELLRRAPERVRGAVLIEPPLLSLSPRGSEAMSELRETVRQAAADEGPAGAVRAFLAAAGGRRALDLLGPERLEAAAAASAAFAADLAAAPRWAYTRRELRAILVPAIVLAGERGGPWREPAAELAELLGSARLESLDSGHFVQLERPDAVVAAVAELAAG